MLRILSKGAARFAGVLATILVFGVCLSGTSASACCSHLTDAKVGGGYYGCGWEDWDLGYVWGGTYYHTGFYSSYGACAGGYTDCNCTYQPPNIVDSRMSGVQCTQTGDVCNGWWDAIDWNGPSYTTCTSGPCAGTGVVETVSPYYDYYLGYFGFTCFPAPLSPARLNQAKKTLARRLLMGPVPGLLSVSMTRNNYQEAPHVAHTRAPDRSNGGSSSEAPLDVKTTSLPDGWIEISITNLSNQAVTAFVLFSEHTPLVSTVRYYYTIKWVDSIFSPHDRPIMPNETQRFKYGGPNPGPDRVRTEVSLKAAVFADGTAFGDPVWGDRLIQGRKSLFEHFGKAIQALQLARARSASREELIRTFTETESAELSTTQTPERQRGIRTAYGTVIANLQRSTTPNGAVIALDNIIDGVLREFLERRQRLLSSKPSIAEGKGPLNP